MTEEEIAAQIAAVIAEKDLPREWLPDAPRPVRPTPAPSETADDGAYDDATIRVLTSQPWCVLCGAHELPRDSVADCPIAAALPARERPIPDAKQHVLAYGVFESALIWWRTPAVAGYREIAGLGERTPPGLPVDPELRRQGRAYANDWKILERERFLGRLTDSGEWRFCAEPSG